LARFRPRKNQIWQERENMRRLFIAVLGALTFVAIAAPTSAHTYEYCRRTEISSHMLSCSFDTVAQCKATSSGIGGECSRDPFGGWVTDAYAYAPGYSRLEGRRGHVKATIEKSLNCDWRSFATLGSINQGSLAGF
jgi:Protein of unknown function (DUF3551)